MYHFVGIMPETDVISNRYAFQIVPVMYTNNNHDKFCIFMQVIHN